MTTSGPEHPDGASGESILHASYKDVTTGDGAIKQRYLKRFLRGELSFDLHPDDNVAFLDTVMQERSLQYSPQTQQGTPEDEATYPLARRTAIALVLLTIGCGSGFLAIHNYLGAPESEVPKDWNLLPPGIVSIALAKPRDGLCAQILQAQVAANTAYRNMLLSYGQDIPDGYVYRLQEFRDAANRNQAARVPCRTSVTSFSFEDNSYPLAYVTTLAAQDTSWCDARKNLLAPAKQEAKDRNTIDGQALTVYYDSLIQSGDDWRVLNNQPPCA